MNSRLTFVYGALRSGTTLFGLMLNSHNDITNVGEVDFIFDYLTKNTDLGIWTYDFEGLRRDRIFQSNDLNILDSIDGKRVALNFFTQFQKRTRGHLVCNTHRNLNKIAALIPDAKIVHIIRDPRDVARSCIAMGWAGTAYFGIDQWLETENSWDCFVRECRKDSIKELFYEDLICNPEEQLKIVCCFIGIPYSPDMLDYHTQSTYEAPDPSAIEQWRTKLTAREVALVEIRTKRFLVDRRYELSGYPLCPPGSLEKARLIWKNKTYKWKFGCRRYGYVNYLMEKVTRKVARPFHSIFVQQMNEITIKHLK